MPRQACPVCSVNLLYFVRISPNGMEVCVKRILHISKYYEPFKGGIEEVARNTVNSLLDCSEQKVFCFNHRNGEDTVDLVNGVEVFRCGCKMCLCSQPISLRLARNLKKMIDAFKPELIIFHYPNPYVAFFLLKILSKKVKLIVYWHMDIIQQKFLRCFFYFQNLSLLKRAETIIATNPNYIAGSWYLSRFREKVVVIPNSIDEGRLEKEPSVVEELTKRIRSQNIGKTGCLSVGRLVPYKGFEYLVKVAKKLNERFVFYIIGTGRLLDKLEKMTLETTNVKFLGMTSDAELMAYYRAADVFCFPSVSKNEAFGVALAEAMYFRLPAVTFSIPGSGVNYVSLNGITGLEAPNRDVGAFADCILELSKDESKRNELKENAHTRVVENFLFPQFQKKIKKLVEMCS